jgi:putative transposase
VVDLVLQQFLRAGAEQDFALIAFCFMPDHVHLLVAGTLENADGKRYIALAKQYSGFYYKKAHHRRLWQRYPFERVLRNDEATLAAAR